MLQLSRKIKLVAFVVEKKNFKPKHLIQGYFIFNVKILKIT